jgi:hypothetical protein
VINGASKANGRNEKCIDYNVLVGKPKGKRLLWRIKHRWKDNIKTDVKKQGMRMWTGFVRIGLGASGGFL